MEFNFRNDADAAKFKLLSVANIFRRILEKFRNDFRFWEN